MEVGGVTGSPTVVDANSVGFGGLNSDDFMKLLITELQNQDPTEPVSNEQLLNQLSTMRNLQSNIELADTLKEITAGQQLTSAAAFIGKEVTATTADGVSVTGVVDRAFVHEGTTYLGIGEAAVPVSDVDTLHGASAA